MVQPIIHNRDNIMTVYMYLLKVSINCYMLYLNCVGNKNTFSSG